MKKIGYLLLIIMCAVLIVLIAALGTKILKNGEMSGPGILSITQNGNSGDVLPEETVPSEVPENTGENPVPEAAPGEIKAGDEAAAAQETEGNSPGDTPGDTPGEIVSSEQEEAAEEGISEEETEELLGRAINFSFENMSNDVWSGYIVLPDGTKADRVLPVMTGSGGSDMVLADGYRKIVCVERSGDELVPCVIKNGNIDDAAMVSYSVFIEIRDLFASVGWKKDEGQTLPDDVKEALSALSIPADRLKYIGENENHHIFSFTEGSSSDYEELYRKESEIFNDPSGPEYVLIMR